MGDFGSPSTTVEPKIYIYIYIYILGSAEKFIGWPKYSYEMWPNEVYFSTKSTMPSPHFFHHCCCAWISLEKKVCNSRYDISQWIFCPLLYIYIYIYIYNIYIYMCVCVCVYFYLTWFARRIRGSYLSQGNLLESEHHGTTEVQTHSLWFCSPTL